MSHALRLDDETDAPFLGVAASVTGRRWTRRRVEPRTAEAIAQRLGIHPVLAEIVAGRGVGLAEAPAFLKPSLRDNLPDPSILKDADAAAERLADAVQKGEAIGVFGDYDVDGTVSSALLSRWLRALGTPHHVHLPDRLSEGYGPNLEAFRGLTQKGASLIVTVDCGAHAPAVLAAAAEEGMQVIVIDHHLPSDPLPPAFAQVNPNRPDDLSGLGGLSAAGVLFMTLIAANRALRRRGAFIARPEPKLIAWLDLVALSLVCDVMPLTGLTRTLVAQGLRVLGGFDEGVPGGNPGARALARVAGAKGLAQASHLGFQIGPRINAAGRIGHARTAFDLLSTDDPEKAAALAARLQSLNGARQDVEAQVLAQARQQAAGAAETGAVVVAGEGWHPGVIGIVAGRLKESLGRPAVVIALEGEEGKGSARSVPGVDIGSAIAAAAEAGVIEGGGGHPMAAGLSLRADQIEDFRAFLDARLAEGIAAARATRRLVLDGAVSLAEIKKPFCDAIAPAGPYGQGNPEPRFAAEAVRVKDLRVVGETHIAFTAQDRMGRTARAIAFRCLGEPLGALLQDAQGGGAVHLAGKIKPDDWRGGDCAQLHVEDGAAL